MIIRMIWCLILVLVLQPSVAVRAGDVSSSDIVGALAKPGTRSLLAPPALASDEGALLDTLASAGTRRIVVEERQALAAMVEKYQMPSIDLDIYFAFDSAGIDAEAVPALVELGTALTSPALAGRRFLVTGHTDAKGGADYNLALSEDRAQSVKAYLSRTFGIAGAKLIAVGYGEELLKLPDDPEAAQNRRVTIIAVGED